MNLRSVRFKVIQLAWWAACAWLPTLASCSQLPSQQQLNQVAGPQAQAHINLETCILDDDEVGQRCARALLAKQSQGVQVHLMHDSMGTLGTPAASFQALEFNPVRPSKAEGNWRPNQHNQRKLLIVDGQTAILGGINTSSVYSGGSSGRLFGGSSPRAAEPQGHARAGAPDDAETSIHITNTYFAPDPLWLSALEGAAQRGVAVQLILPRHSDSWLVFHAGRSHYSRLLRAGVKLHERRDVILHAKTALIDGVWATVGSTNLDWRSFLHNHELNAVVLGSDFGGQVQRMFERDLAASNPVLLQPWEDRSLGLKLKEWLARLWEYWL